jgi:hypothetical protein
MEAQTRRGGSATVQTNEAQTTTKGALGLIFFILLMDVIGIRDTEKMLRNDHAADLVTVKTSQGTVQETTVIPDSYFVLIVPTGGDEPLRYPCFKVSEKRFRVCCLSSHTRAQDL